MIPGSPQDVEVVGIGSDRVKLSWKPPELNPEAVEVYVVLKKVKGRTWEEVKRTKKTKTLILGLKMYKSYEFEVMATNSLMMSLAESNVCVTNRSKAADATLTGVAGVIGSAFMPTLMLMDKLDPDCHLSTAADVGLCAAGAPLCFLLAPVTVPLFIG